jgi:ketosteroid isomerase-like protein
MDQLTAEEFARGWYAAWNAHDLAGILEHYADDVELTSPFVAVLTGDASGRIAGKGALRSYFAVGLAKYPELHFEPLDLFVGVRSLVLHYRGVTGRTAELVELDDDNRIRRYLAHYTEHQA